MIGIFGGTFDPVHYGHIKPALSVKQALNLSQLRFIPNRMPPHREVPWLSVEQRLAMLRCALSEFPDVFIDERELKRDGPSYMVDTLHSLQDDFPDEQLCLIIGMDAFFGITSWYKWRTIFDLCQLVVTTRPGFDRNSIKAHMDNNDYQFLAQRMTTDVNAFAARDLSRELPQETPQESPQEKGKILLQSVPQLDISSSLIRENLQKGEKISQWMPPQVYQILRGFMNDN